MNIFPLPLVMIIDDNRIDNIFNKKMIEREKLGEKIVLFSDVESAWSYLSVFKDSSLDLIPSLIFLDLTMPLKNGYSFLELYKTLPLAIRNNIKIIIISSNIVSDAEEQELKNNYPVLACLTKPLKRNDIKSLMVQNL